MKFLKWLLIVLLSLVALVLIIPLFIPSTAVVTVEKEVAVSPMQVFVTSAVFENRDQWDPWLEMEPEAKVTITANPEYIGSTYEWEGEKIGSGKMRVDSIVYPSYIASSIWFGGSEDASLVEWMLEKTDAGTKVTWKFSSEGKYPVGRLFLLFMKGSLSKSFEKGMENFKSYIEANPPAIWSLSEIVVDHFDERKSMVIPAEGTMEEIGAQMMEKYPILFKEVAMQGLQNQGPAFAWYIDFDEKTGFSHVLLGAPVVELGKANGDVKPKTIPAMKALVAKHTGSYEGFQDSYAKMMTYVAENNISVEGPAFEIYLVPMTPGSDGSNAETLIGFPLKTK